MEKIISSFDKALLFDEKKYSGNQTNDEVIAETEAYFDAKEKSYYKNGINIKCYKVGKSLYSFYRP